MDALYFRVSSDRQTTENQFEDLLQVAEREGGRDWAEIRRLLSHCVREEQLFNSRSGTRTVYRIRTEVAEKLADQCLYIEQGKSGKTGARRRPMFERMKRDAAIRKFDRLLVWKVSRLGRDMREVISTVYELADLRITVVPVKLQTGAITSTMGKLLWAIQAWYAEMENDERSQTIKAGLERARKGGKQLGRKRKLFDRLELIRLRDQEGLSWREIAHRSRLSVRTIRRVLQDLPSRF